MNEKLTAEQVMAIVGKHQPDYCSDTHVCFDWQAIADELNARTERITGEEIVRCWDCKHHEYMSVSYLDKPLSVCLSEQWIGAEGDNPLVKPDGFCAWGERE